MTKKERNQLQSLISKHVAAQVALSWSGSQDPEDREIIEANSEYAKRKLYNWISMRVDQ